MKKDRYNRPRNKKRTEFNVLLRAYQQFRSIYRYGPSFSLPYSRYQGCQMNCCRSKLVEAEVVTAEVEDTAQGNSHTWDFLWILIISILILWCKSDYGSDYVDPYVVLASLGFGVFLFNIIYNLLNRSARSLDVSDFDLVCSSLQKKLCNYMKQYIYIVFFRRSLAAAVVWQTGRFP